MTFEVHRIEVERRGRNRKRGRRALKARQHSVLTQADVAARKGAQTPVVASGAITGNGQTLTLHRDRPEICECVWQKIGATRGVR